MLIGRIVEAMEAMAGTTSATDPSLQVLAVVALSLLEEAVGANDLLFEEVETEVMITLKPSRSNLVSSVLSLVDRARTFAGSRVRRTAVSNSWLHPTAAHSVSAKSLALVIAEPKLRMPSTVLSTTAAWAF